MTIKTEVKALHLAHPENGAPAMATVVKNWFENGRFTGYVLQFSGEASTRYLRFDQIRDLQGWSEEAES